MTLHSLSTTMPLRVEFSLPFLIERSEITQPCADRRRNGIENTLADLVRRWRTPRPLDAAQELRMCAETGQVARRLGRGRAWCWWGHTGTAHGLSERDHQRRVCAGRMGATTLAWR